MMKLEVKPGMTIGQIKQAFVLKYPFLKLEIVSCKKSRGHCAGKCMVNDQKFLFELQPRLIGGSITLDSNIKVKELETAFLEQFLLNVQVFRRSGSIWLETTVTDSWTLQEQNDHAKHSCETKNPAEKLEEDYELTRDAD